MVYIKISVKVEFSVYPLLSRHLIWSSEQSYNYAWGKFTGKEPELKDDKQLAQDQMDSNNGDWLWTTGFPSWGFFLTLVLIMNPHNVKLKTIFPSKCTLQLHILVKILYYLNLFDHVRGKRPIWKRVGKFLPL